jgi:hypothetical protein
VRQAPFDELGLFDKEKLLGCLQQASLGIASRDDGLHRLDLALAFIKWFSMQSVWQREQTPVEIVRAGRREAA